jgi:hypothetical protein
MPLWALLSNLIAASLGEMVDRNFSQKIWPGLHRPATLVL